MSNTTYEIKGKTKNIKATSRCAIHIHDTYYTIELSEERELPKTDDIDLDAEYADLFNSINDEVDKQCSDIIKGTK